MMRTADEETQAGPAAVGRGSMERSETLTIKASLLLAAAGCQPGMRTNTTPISRNRQDL